MAPDTSVACRIESAIHSPGGGISAFTLSDGEGRHWQLACDELMGAIASGRMTCYVTVDGHAHLVTLRSEAGRKSLVTFLGELETLLPDRG